MFCHFVVDIRDAKLVHSIDPKQSPSANLPSVADFSHPYYDESATSSMFSLLLLKYISFWKSTI
jgi:hypothetical protein